MVLKKTGWTNKVAQQVKAHAAGKHGDVSLSPTTLIKEENTSLNIIQGFFVCLFVCMCLNFLGFFFESFFVYLWLS